MEAVTVVARFRGAESGDDDFGDWRLTDNTIKHTEKHHEFNFDSVLNPSRTQAELYEAAGRKIINFFCDGYNATIFAYGQSGSGKTFSMLGPETVTDTLVNKSEVIPPEVEALFGITPRATFHIFENIRAGEAKGTKYELHISYIEVYNEMINDILTCPPGTNLKLREFPGIGMRIIDVHEDPASTAEAVFEGISAGTANRIVCSTGQNARSSRSHTVFIISLKQTLIDGTVKSSKINLVDLAGSEKLSKTGAEGQALKEAQKINLSLTTLGRCIKALTCGGGEHVPYRESKLTLILKESLSGAAMTVLIVTGSMRKVHQEETIGTMQFAERAKMVKTSAKSNSKRSYEELERLVDKLTQEVAAIKKALQSGGTLPFEPSSEISEVPAAPKAMNIALSVEYEELKIKYQTLDESSLRQIDELKQILERAETKMGNVEFVAIQEEIESFKTRLEEGTEQIKLLEQEKLDENSCFQEKLIEIQQSIDQAKAKFEEAKDKISESHNELEKIQEKLREKDSEIFKLSQRSHKLSESKKKYKQEIKKFKEMIESGSSKSLEAQQEMLKYSDLLQEAHAAKKDTEKIIEDIMKESEPLVKEIAELEVREASFTEEIMNLKIDLENYVKKSKKMASRVEKHDSELKVLEFEYLQQKEEIISKKNELDQELRKLQIELESLNKSQAELTSEEAKENYVREVLSIYESQLSSIKSETNQVQSHIEELGREYQKQVASNSSLVSENEELKKNIAEALEKQQKLEKSLEEEKSLKDKTFAELKNVEESQQRLIEEAEARVKKDMYVKIQAFVIQEEEMKVEVEKKELELARFKETIEMEANKVNEELAIVKKSLHDNEKEVKSIHEDYLLKEEQVLEENCAIEKTIKEKSEKIEKLKETILMQEAKIKHCHLQIEKLEADIKHKISERDTERKNSIIRQTIIPKRGTIFNKASSAPQEDKGKLPGFILRKTDNKFLNDAIREAETLAKSEHAISAFKVEYEFQAIKALYGNLDDTVIKKKGNDAIIEADEDRED